MATQRIAVVTGANKGIGFAIVKELCAKFEGRVYLTARDEGRGASAVEELKKSTATEPFGKQAENTIRVNYFGTLAVCHALFPLLRPHARVCHVSSSSGHLSRICGDEPAATQLRAKLSADTLTEDQLADLMNQFVEAAKDGTFHQKGWPGSSYVVSKVGVSALTRIQHRAFLSDSREDLVVNSCHPGYVDTDMNLHDNPVSIEEGAVCPAYLALLPPNISEPKGEYLWCDKSVVDWTGKNPASV